MLSGYKETRTLYIAHGNKNGIVTVENNLAIPSQIKTELPYNPTTPLLGIYIKIRKQEFKQILAQQCSYHNSQKTFTTKTERWMGEQKCGRSIKWNIIQS